jgi:phosphatidylserine synthase
MNYIVNYRKNAEKMNKPISFMWFSLRYAKKENYNNNPILYLMYGLSYPLSFLLNYFGVSPNKITTLSIIFSLLAAVALIEISYLWFCIFWFFAIFLDFCDGTVARMTDNFSNRALDYDHMSDLFKMALIFLSVSIYHSSGLIWVLSFSSLFLLLYYTIINHDLTHFNKNKVVNYVSLDRSSGFINKAKKFVNKNRLFRNFFSLFMTIDGHTLFIFFMIPINKAFAAVVLASLIFILLVQVLRNGYRLYAIKL